MSLIRIDTTEDVTVRCACGSPHSLEKIKSVYINTDNISSIIEDESPMAHDFRVYMTGTEDYIISVYLSVISDNSGIVSNIRNQLGMN